MGKKVTLWIGCIVLLTGLLIFLFYMLIFTQEEKRSSIELQINDTGWKLAMAARAYISNDELRYDEAYVAGGYPEKNTGVCTDVVWNAFFGIDVNLKYLVDKDIEQNMEAYVDVLTVADPNIDFRRVSVLEIFFQRQAEVLTTDPYKTWEWQAGDIVIFESSHIAIVSNLRNLWGMPYIIQHGKDPAAEEDRLVAVDGMKISGHYRWSQ